MSTPTMPAPSYPYHVVGTAADGSEIRKFADSGIQSAVDQVVNDELQGHWSWAIVGHYTNDNTAQGLVVFNKKLADGKYDFTVAGSLSHSFATGDTTKEAWIALRG